MQVPVYKANGEVAETVDLSDDVFGVPLNQGVVHQAMVRHLANRRLGTVQTKTRSTVSGSGKKLYAQKHTGRARRGDVTSPVLSGGAVAFGPHPRDHRQRMPKKMRRLAIRGVLSGKLADGELKLVDGLGLDEARTRRLAETLAALGITGSVLIATDEVEHGVTTAARNLPGVSTTTASLLNIVDVMNHRNLLMTLAAARKAEAMWRPVKSTPAPAGDEGATTGGERQGGRL